ncbi:MAG: nuclear transport factor 2 family protein [Burkholderiales bacterium]|nr:nuclear transport factor 2 family protein [Burkholderiales bacterium]
MSDQKKHTRQEQNALALFERHFAAFKSGNIESVLRDFGENSVVVTPDGVFQGIEQIRTVYDGLLAEFGNIDRGDSPGLWVDTMHVRDELLFITWHAESKGLVFPFGTDTFICKGDRFLRQSISFSSPLQRMSASAIRADSVPA